MIIHVPLCGQNIYDFAKQHDCYVLGAFPKKFVDLIVEKYDIPATKLIDYMQFNALSTNVQLNIVVAYAFIEWIGNKLLAHPLEEYKKCNFYLVKGAKTE